jgi:hypothetical protein
VGGTDKYTNKQGQHSGGLKGLLQDLGRSLKGSTAEEKASAALGLKHGYWSNLADHGRIHARLDPVEQILGEAGKPPGTTTLGQMESKSVDIVANYTGCDAKDLKRQLREYHSKEPYRLARERSSERIRLEK